jgi:hypothetical protein
MHIVVGEIRNDSHLLYFCIYLQCMTRPFGNGNCSSKSVIAKAWMAELCK